MYYTHGGTLKYASARRKIRIKSLKETDLSEAWALLSQLQDYPLTAKASDVFFFHQHTEWCQSPRFVPETTSIPDIHMGFPPGIMTNSIIEMKVPVGSFQDGNMSSRNS